MSGTYAYQFSTMLRNGGFTSPCMSPCADLCKTFRAGTAICAVLAFLIYMRDSVSVLPSGGIGSGVFSRVLRGGIRPHN